MKILMLGPSKDSMGGIATVIKNFHEYFNEKDIDIIYLETWKEGTLKQRLLLTISIILKTIKCIITEKIDMLHIHVAQDGSFYRKSLIIVISKILNKKVLLHIHASQFDKFYLKSNVICKWYIKRILNLPDKLVVLSKEWKEFFIGITKNDIDILHNAVNVKEYEYNSNGNIVSFMGRLGERKGVYDILSISEQLLNQNENIKLYLCGDGEIDAVKQIIKEKGLEDKIIVTGWISKEEKEYILNNTIINLLPSYNEGMPMAILETMALGIPNISSNVGGIPQVIINMENGLLNNAGDNEALLQSLNLLLLNDSIRVKLSVNAFNTIKNEYSINAYNIKISEIYRSIARGSK